MLVVQNAGRPAAIRHALNDLLHPATDDIKVAAAYVTQGGTELFLDLVRRKLGRNRAHAAQKVLITSFDFGLTEPVALKTWLDLPGVTVRVAGARLVRRGVLTPTVAFHPKLYFFGYEALFSSVLVGSANLTNRGLSINTEAGWAEVGVARGDADAAFSIAQEGTEPLTLELLEAYQQLRSAQPPPPSLAQEVGAVPLPSAPPVGELFSFRDAVDQGILHPECYDQMWIQVENLQGGSQNQLELPRGAHRFFGFRFAGYEASDKVTIGVPILVAGVRRWKDRLLTWHGNNMMERMNLPTLAQGGFTYDHTAVMFRRIPGGEFELIVAPWEDDLARSWRSASAAAAKIFRLSSRTTRVAGFI